MSSTFLNARYADIHPYQPGEQPKDRAYVKLNANETSVAPSPKVAEALADPRLVQGLGRYADPHCMPIRESIASSVGTTPDHVFCGNGSDEVLAFLFLAFFGDDARVCFPDVTYGFYRDYCDAFGVGFREIALHDDFTLDVDAFCVARENVVIANPNAPTGLVIPTSEVARVCQAGPKRLVIVDEAYVDYGSKSCASLVDDNPNLIVVQTMSKSRNLAGAHIGWAIASPEIVLDLNDIKFCFNPFNLSAPTMAIGIASLSDEAYFDRCVATVIKERGRTTRELVARGFEVLDSHANFIFCHKDGLDAVAWNQSLRQRGVLCRHYAAPRITDWLRVTIGTRHEMEAFLAATDEVLAEL